VYIRLGKTKKHGSTFREDIYDFVPVSSLCVQYFV